MNIPTEILYQHVAVLGKTRSGKSSVMRGLVERLLDDSKPVCIVDPKGDWWGIKLAKDGKHKGYPVVIFGGEHADIPIDEHSGHLVAELFATGNRPCLIDLGGWMVGPRTRFWIDFASTLFKHSKGNRWLAVDEIHNFAPKGKVFDADAGKALHWTNRLASEGLGKGIQMLFASQRPQKVHNDTLTSAETLIAMRVLHPSDRGAVSDWIKGCGDSAGDEVLASLAQMDRGEGWVWSPEIGFGPKRNKFPMFKTYDSFRPQTVDETSKLTGWAEVDLDEIRQKFAATLEKAKADDPRELRKQIAQLQTELKKANSFQAIQRPVVEEKRIEVPILTDEDRKLLKDTRGFMEFTLTNMEMFKGNVESVRALCERIAKFQSPAPTQVPRHAAALITHENPPKERTIGTATSAPSSLTGPEQRIVDAIAWLESIGVDTPEQTAVAFLAGYTFGGGGFNNPRGALNTKGLVEYVAGNRIRLTDAGRQHAHPPDAALTTKELHRAVLDRLPGPEQKILKVILDHYPESITNEQCASESGYTVGAGGYNNPRGRLRTLGLIDYPEGGKVRARDILFID